MDVATQNINYLNTQTFGFSTNICPSLTEYVTSVAIPGLTLGEAVVETPFVKRPEPGDKLIFSVMGISFLVDEEMKNWGEVYDWMTALGFPDNFQQYGNFTNAKRVNLESVFSDIIIIIYSNQSTPLLKFTFKDAFPIALGDIPLTSSDTSASPAVCTADFMYRSYDFEKLT